MIKKVEVLEPDTCHSNFTAEGFAWNTLVLSCPLLIGASIVLFFRDHERKVKFMYTLASSK